MACESFYFFFEKKLNDSAIYKLENTATKRNIVFSRNPILVIFLAPFLHAKKYIQKM